MRFVAITCKAVWLAAGVALALMAGNACAKTVTITFATWAVKTETDELTNTIFPKFEAENPGIKVKLLSTGDYTTKMISMMAAGKAPDLLQVEEPMMDWFDQSGQLMNLSAYIKKDKLHLSDYIDIMEGRAYWDSNPIDLPYHAVTSAVYYNRALLSQAGLKDPDKTWDWETFADMAKKTTKDANGDGKPETYGFLLHEWECIWAPFMWSNGGYVYDKQMSPTKVTITSPQAIEAMRFLQDCLPFARASRASTGMCSSFPGVHTQDAHRPA